MKKFLALVLSVLMMTAAAVSALGMENARFDWVPADNSFKAIPRDDNVLARIVMGSDVHIGDVYASPKLENAYSSIGKLGGADAFVLIGDLTDGGHEAQYDELMRIVSASSKSLTVDVDGFNMAGAGASAPVDTTILAMGNHEYYGGLTNEKTQELFTEKTGQDTDKVYWVAGKVPVIKISMTSASYKDNFVSKHDFIKTSLEEITATGYKGHIFFVSHMATGDTVIGSPSEEDEPFAKKTVELLAKYPQVIHVSGHSHQMINNPTFIDQSAGFTSITDGVVGEDYGNEVEYLGSGIIVFDVKSDGTTDIHRIDLENGEILYGHEQWTLDASDTAEDFIYFTDKSDAKNPDSYTLKSQAPSFPSDAWVRFEVNDDHDSVDVTFTSNATPASENNHDYIRRYRIRATPADGEGTTVTVNAVNDMYRHEENRAKTMTVTLKNLDWNEDYKITVYAQTSYGVNSKSITADGYANVGIPEFEDLRLLYDIDYSYGDMNDSMGHTATLSRVAKEVYDEEIGQNAIQFNAFHTNRYEFGSDELADITSSFTFETYFKLTDNTTKQTVIGMYNCAAVALEVESGALAVRLHSVNSSDNLSDPIPVEANEWVHVIVTYDGKDMRLYVNSELVLTERRGGGLSATYDENPDENDLVINIGGRSPSGVESYLLAKGSLVNCFRLYSGRMTADEVALAYEKTTKPNIILPFEDVEDGAWFETSVRYAYEEGLMNGTSATAFSPSVNTSRAMIVQMLYNMEGAPAVEYNDVFTDVEDGAWYADAVIWAYENGVTTGSSATTFSPDALVTREQVAVFLYRYLKDYKKAEMDEGADLSGFPDADEISPYAGFAEAMSWANGVGIVNGKGSGDAVALAPLDKAQRCETATMFARFHRSFVM